VVAVVFGYLIVFKVVFDDIFYCSEFGFIVVGFVDEWDLIGVWEWMF